MLRLVRSFPLSLAHTPRSQFGVYSLDRTNFVQDILSRLTLEQYLLLVRREWLQSNSLWSYHRELWAENGDALSRIYAGTGALNTSYTRSGKRTLAGEDILNASKRQLIASQGVLSDATKSVSRAYINNFQDKGKQTAIDMFLVRRVLHIFIVLNAALLVGQYEQPSPSYHFRSHPRLCASSVVSTVCPLSDLPHDRPQLVITG